MRHGKSEGYNAWYYIDGELNFKSHTYVFLSVYFLAKRESGVWIHGTDNNDLTWFNPKWCCNDGGINKPGGGDVLFSILADSARWDDGCFCDWDSTLAFNFICEGSL